MKPAGVLKSALKNNSNKKWREHDEWMKGKAINRPKQRWVWDVEPYETNSDATDMGGSGHWEKVTA